MLFPVIWQLSGCDAGSIRSGSGDYTDWLGHTSFYWILILLMFYINIFMKKLTHFVASLLSTHWPQIVSGQISSA